MAILEHELRSATNAAIGLRRHLTSRDEYYAMVAAGVYGDRRLEMIEGEIVETAPIGPGHASISHPLAKLLETAFGHQFTVRNQVPISLGDDDFPSEPQPDLAVVTGNWKDYRKRHPRPSEIKLVVELADSSLAEDRTIKASLYAAAGIPEYWIVNLVENCVLVHLGPTVAGYTDIKTYSVGDAITPLLAQANAIVLADFLE